ncbi:MAG: hypothetical protein Q4G03_04405 [Planctomycetia bacterium]|nr:hypothetical protein [Planctomycetia bacterium]
MSIVVTCENGHKLSAPEKLAGTVGKCPACGVAVKIPEQRKAPSDSSILRILGVGQELRDNLAKYDAGVLGADASEDLGVDAFGSAPLKSKSKERARKVCPKCDWEIDAAYKICPKCRYYFMEVGNDIK